jgi:hypothetical protein
MMNLVSGTNKAQQYRATRPVSVTRGGKVVQDLSKVYRYRDALAESMATMALCSGQDFEVVTVDEAIQMYESNKTQFTSFTFIKVRECTTRTITTKKWSGYKPKTQPKPRTENPDQYSVFDTNVARGMSQEDLESGRAMRSFNKNTLVSMKHNGKLYIIA